MDISFRQDRLLVIGKSHFLSICLMAIASSIAITEYVMYKPIPISTLPDEEGVISTKVDDENDTDDTEDINVESQVLLKNDSNNDVKIEAKAPEISPNSAVVPATKPDADPFKTTGETTITIDTGDTFASLLTSLGFDKTDIYLASKSLSKIYNLKNMKIGQKIIVRGKREASGELTLNGLEFSPNYKHKIVVSKTDSGYSAEKVEVPVKKIIRNTSGTISPKSPEYSLIQCGIKPNLSKEVLKNLSQIVNIKTSGSPIDFEFLYAEFYDDQGNVVKNPQLLYASFLVDGKIKRIYKFKDDGVSEYVDSNGMILRTLASSSSMLNHPLPRMDITSKFGIRRHPISGRIKGHTGVDISASVGTPIRAAASGVITYASYYSGYGRYIKIKHSGTINTAYGHLSRIVVRNGQHVSQGQIIGYTGNSGYSTGPHLHYEVIKNGRFVNPLSFVKQDPQKLTGEKLHRFNQFKKEISLQIVGLDQIKNKTVVTKKYS